MKQLLLITMLWVLALLPGRAQSTTWGFGLPVTATLANGTLTCTVTDPTQGTKTFGQNNVVQFRNADGVVAWATASGYGFATYDVNLHLWQTTGYNVNTAITTLVSAYGVGAWATNSAYGYARYNPARQQWALDGASVNSQCVVATNYGVVTWTTAGGQYGYATYDPVLAQWKADGASGYASITMQTQHGLVAWRTSYTYGAAAYNPVLHRWDSFGYSETFTEQATDNGVAAWTSPTRVAVAAYSPTQRQWQVLSYATNVTAGTLQVTDGTVGFSTSQGAQLLGYRATTNQWQSGQPTELYCALLPAVIPQSPFVYFHNLSVGASNYSLACGDGQTLARRVGWKQYASSSYTPVLTVSNSSTSISCQASVQVTLAAASPQAASRLRPVPNPATGTVLVQLPAGTTRLQLFNLLGQVQWQAPVAAGSEQCSVPLTNLAAGAYLLVAGGGAAPATARLLVY